jgi:hypothetical protein
MSLSRELLTEIRQRAAVQTAKDAATREIERVLGGGKVAGAFHLRSDDPPLFRVRIEPKVAKERGLPADVTFDAIEARGRGDDAFLTLRDAKGRVLTRFGITQWVRGTEVTAAPADRPFSEGPLGGVPTTKEIQMKKDTNTIAAGFQKRVEELERAGKTTREAIAMVTKELGEPAATAYRLNGTGGVEAPEVPAAFNLSAALEEKAASGVPFHQLCDEYAAEKGISLRDAVHVLAPRFAAENS